MEKRGIETINHPYMDRLKKTLESYKYHLTCLEKRMVLIDNDSANCSDFELNEKEILKIKTISEIDVLKRTIKLKEDYFVKYFKITSVELDEMERNFNKIINEAKAKRLKNKAVNKLMSEVRKDVLKSNDEVKLTYYKLLKKALGK